MTSNNERPAVHPKGLAAPMPANAYLDDETDRRQASFDAAGARIFTYKVRVITLYEDRIG